MQCSEAQSGSYVSGAVSSSQCTSLESESIEYGILQRTWISHNEFIHNYHNNELYVTNKINDEIKI